MRHDLKKKKTKTEGLEDNTSHGVLIQNDFPCCRLFTLGRCAGGPGGQLQQASCHSSAIVKSLPGISEDL